MVNCFGVVLVSEFAHTHSVVGLKDIGLVVLPIMSIVMTFKCLLEGMTKRLKLFWGHFHCHFSFVFFLFLLHFEITFISSFKHFYLNLNSNFTSLACKGNTIH